MTVSVQVLEYGARALKSLAILGTEFEATRAEREMRRGGCPAGLGSLILDTLTEAGLLRGTVAGDVLIMTESGRATAAALGMQDWSAYASALLNLPWLQQQMQASLGAVSVGTDGSVVDRVEVARHWPTLGFVLGWLPCLPRDERSARLPTNWLDQLHFAPGRAELPAWVQANNDVGNRAERYSLHFERSRTIPAAVLWVALESDRYGYDIEVQAKDGTRAVEVKGSSASRREFQLTTHELEVASALGGKYVVQFWGEIDLELDMALEYRHLRVLGYPIEYPGLLSLIESGDLSIEASTWHVVDGRS